MAGNESGPDKIETSFAKMQIYKDQLEFDWERFTVSPARCLLQIIEAMQLCRSQRCGAVEGAKFHPGLDEALDTVILEVWSRQFLDEQGKRIDPTKACLLTVVMRLPESAVAKILATTPAAVYAERRG